MKDLGQHFGGELYEAEVHYLIDTEWVVRAEDVLNRRTKHGVHLSDDERAAFTSWFDRAQAGAEEGRLAENDQKLASAVNH